MTEQETAKENIYSTKPVPLSERKPWTYHAVVWAGVCFVLAALMGGATPITLLPFKYSLLAILVGNLILLSIFIGTSYIGAKTGLSTYLVAEHAFGKIGARALINFVASGIPAFAWYGFETWLAAAAIGVVMGWDIGGPGHLMDWKTAAFTIVVGVLMAIPPMRGITSVAIIDFISIPIMMAFTVYGLYLGYTLGVAGKLLTFAPPGFDPTRLASTFLISIHIVVGLIIVGATIAADTARWIHPDRKRVIIASLLGFFSIAVFMEIVGMFYAIAAMGAGLSADVAWNIVLILKQLGAGAFYLYIMLILAFILQFTTNMLNAYSGGLALTATFNRPRLRPWFTLAGALFGSIIAVAGVIWYWIPYLITLANWVAPIAGVILAEFYILRKSNIVGEAPRLKAGALVSWLLGGLTSYLLIRFQLLFVVPSVLGLIVAAVLHIAINAISRSVKK